VLRVLTMAKIQANQRSDRISNCAIGAMCRFVTDRSMLSKYSAIPSPDNLARPLQKSNPKGLQDELIPAPQRDGRMSSFDFGVQLLDAAKMTYWHKHYDANFWIENASVKWKEAEAPFHTVARLTLLPQSQLRPDAGEVTYFDVTRHSTADSTPLGSINRARCFGRDGQQRSTPARERQSPKWNRCGCIRRGA